MTFPLATLAVTIGPDGISAPPESDILESLKATFRSIYGADAYLEADSQDGQWLAFLAKSQSDCNDAVKAGYSAFAPSSAVGAGLSANVKINGLARQPATNSQATLLVNGTPGTVISKNKKFQDVLGQTWLASADSTIPGGGTIAILAIAQDPGPIQAAPTTIIIQTNPQVGVASVSNPADAVPGQDAEDDATLRGRQASSTALAAQVRLAAMQGAVEAVAGVTSCRVYENETGSTDANGLPAHSIGFVIAGGDPTAIATALMLTKSPGSFMFGSTSQTVVDSIGNTQTMRWTIPTFLDIKVVIDLQSLPGYTDDVGAKIKNALHLYVNSLPSGTNVYWSRLFAPALLEGDPDGNTYHINTLLTSILAGSPAAADVAVVFGQEPQLQIVNVAITAH